MIGRVSDISMTRFHQDFSQQGASMTGTFLLPFSLRMRRSSWRYRSYVWKAVSR